MRILVLQHSDKEHAGAFRAMFQRDGLELVACNAPQEIGDIDLSGIDGLWVLGGPMHVWQSDELPWLRQEIELIRHAVIDKRLPYFGICLGHQLLAHVLGGTVSLSAKSEIGLLEATRLGEPPLFNGVSERFLCFQWHSAEVSKVPEGVQVHAASGSCGVQAMSWGETASSVQFHAELDGGTLSDWYQIDGCEDMLKAEIGDAACSRVFADLAAAEAELGRLRTSLYQNWLAGLNR